jgi:hypothetical protein
VPGKSRKIHVFLDNFASDERVPQLISGYFKVLFKEKEKKLSFHLVVV